MAAIFFAIFLCSSIAPWRWIWRLWIFVITLDILLGPFIEDQKMGAGNTAMSFGPILVVLAAALLLAIRLIAATVRAVRCRGHPKGERPVYPDQPFIRKFDVILLAMASVLAGKIGASTLAMKGLGLVYPGHVLGIILSVVTIVVLTSIWLLGRLPARWRRRAFMLSIASIVAAASLCHSALYPRQVMRSAIARADGDPYCIAMNISRRPVLSVQDMTFFGFDNGNLRHHAILLVDRHGDIEPYHWSYRKKSFEPGVWFWEESRDNLSRVDCRPEKDFVERLPAVRRPKTGHQWFYVDGQLLEIPTSYEPEVFLGDIEIAAVPPHFIHTSHLSDSRRVRSARRDHIWLDNFADEAIDLPPAGQIGDLHAVRVAGHDGNLYYRLDRLRSIETFVTCHDDRPKETACWHRFYQDGRMYSFTHGLDLIDQSSNMKKNLVNLFASFEVPH